MSFLINPYAFGGGAATVTWNPSDKHADIALSGGDLVATKGGATNASRSLRATLGRSTGKFYFEIAVTAGGTSPFMQIGVATSSLALTGSLNAAAGWCYYQDTGAKQHNSTSTAYGASYTTGDVIGVAVDLDSGKIWFAKNNAWQGSGDPAAGTNEAFSSLSGTIYPAAALYRKDAPVHVLTARFKSSDFTYSPPAGFSPWGS